MIIPLHVSIWYFKIIFNNIVLDHEKNYAIQTFFK